MDLVRLALERCATAAEAVATIEVLVATVGQGGSGHDGERRPYWSSFLVADPVERLRGGDLGPSLAVEQVDRRARPPPTGRRSWASTPPHRHPRQPVATLVDPRLEASRRVLAEAPVTVASLQAHLASHEGGDGGWTVCMHVDGPEHREATTAAIVAELPRTGPPVAHVVSGSPCRGGWERRVVGSASVTLH